MNQLCSLINTKQYYYPLFCLYNHRRDEEYVINFYEVYHFQQRNLEFSSYKNNSQRCHNKLLLFKTVLYLL